MLSIIKRHNRYLLLIAFFVQHASFPRTPNEEMAVAR